MQNLTGLDAAQREQITFLTGIDENGTVANDTYYTYATKDFSTTRVWLNKWYNDDAGSPLAASSAAGTPGGTVTYAFTQNLSPQEQAAYTGALTLWSDIANVKFERVPTVATANIRFEPEANGTDGYTFIPNNGSVSIGTGVTQIPAQTSPNALGGQAAIGLAGKPEAFDSFDIANSQLMSNVAHEIGHVIGLGHAGFYNGAAFDGQSGPYDQGLWSIMSYVNTTGQENQPYAPQAPVVADWQYAAPQTPMALDILAIQRLYGASTSATFAGGQTYGFNSNITGASGAYFDFTKNTTPFVTLYNTGGGNTLDVSGFSTDCKIDLNPGRFSTASANSLITNNVCIAYGTRIDTAVTGSGNDVIYGNGDSNRIDGGAGSNTFVLSGSSANYTVVTTGTSTLVTDKSTGAVDTLTNIQSIQFAAPVCFTTGTRIDVIRNGAVVPVAVEDLNPGDTAVTATGDRRTIRWIGRRQVFPDAHPVPSTQWPVRVLAGAFGTGGCGRPLPVRDLRLSPGHPVLVGADADNEGGVLVPIMCLINGTTIRRDPVKSVTYWHVELDRHDLLVAEGLPAESYFECGTRTWFKDQAARCTPTGPDAVNAAPTGRCRPVAVAGALVEAERRRIDTGFSLRLSSQAAWPGAEVLGSWIPA